MNLYNGEYACAVGNPKGYTGLAARIRAKTFIKAMQPHPHDKILEIGCNTGMLLRAIRQHAPAVGIDVNEAALAHAKLPDTHCMNATRLSFSNDSFTKICAFEVVEHIPAYRKTLKETHRVLQDGGHFYVSFPWELFRGQAAIGDSIRVYKHPFNAGKLHVNRFTPKTFARAVSGLFTVMSESVVWIPSPSYLLVLQKTRGSDAHPLRT